MLIYFARGRLPWHGLKAHSTSEKNRLVLDRKIALNVEGLCSGLPQEFTEYIKYVKTLT